MNIELYHRMLIHDEKGKLIKRTHWKKSESFLLQFLQHLDAAFSTLYGNTGTAISIKDLGGASRTIQGQIASPLLWQFMCVFDADNSAAYGIQVGTGITTPTNADYVMATLIAHGVGSGQLDYGAHSRTAAQVVGANVDFVISRTFYNGSGASITVNEIGIACSTRDTGATQRYFLLARDVVTAVTVDNAKTLTVQYTVRTTV